MYFWTHLPANEGTGPPVPGISKEEEGFFHCSWPRILPPMSRLLVLCAGWLPCSGVTHLARKFNPVLILLTLLPFKQSLLANSLEAQVVGLPLSVLSV